VKNAGCEVHHYATEESSVSKYGSEPPEVLTTTPPSFIMGDEEIML
jgi:hypothetical protein